MVPARNPANKRTRNMVRPSRIGMRMVVGEQRGVDIRIPQRLKVPRDILIMIHIRRPLARVIPRSHLRVRHEPVRCRHLRVRIIPGVAVRRGAAHHGDPALGDHVPDRPLEVCDEGLHDLGCPVGVGDRDGFGAVAGRGGAGRGAGGAAVVVPEFDDDEVAFGYLGDEGGEQAFGCVRPRGAAAAGEVDDFEGGVGCEGVAPAVRCQCQSRNFHVYSRWGDLRTNPCMFAVEVYAMVLSPAIKILMASTAENEPASVAATKVPKVNFMVNQGIRVLPTVGEGVYVVLRNGHLLVLHRRVFMKFTPRDVFGVSVE